MVIGARRARHDAPLRIEADIGADLDAGAQRDVSPEFREDAEVSAIAEVRADEGNEIHAELLFEGGQGDEMAAEEAQAEAVSLYDLPARIHEVLRVNGGRVARVLAEKHRGVGEDEFVECAGDRVARDIDREFAHAEIADVDLAGAQIVGALVGHEAPAAAGED